MTDQMKQAPTLDALRAQREVILTAARRHGARNVRVFGSVARGEATAGSDVDLLVDFGPGRSLFDLVRLIDELHMVVGRSVDVVTEEELRPRNRDAILADARSL
ncbi:MAG: nucleotidyltransferase family protein [Acidimicrobiales bacterium]